MVKTRIHSLRILTFVLLALLVLGASRLRTSLAAASTAGEAVRRAWRLAQDSGGYHFTTRIVQTTHAAPSLANVGGSSRQEITYIEGDADLPAQALLLRLWQDGGRVTDPDSAIEVRIDKNVAYGRLSGGEWQTVDNFAGSFAPGNDVAAFLVAARNIQGADPGATVPARAASYTFNLHTPTLAEYLRRQLEEQLRAAGELPAGVHLDAPEEIAQTVGNGELWLDQDGLPLRLVIALNYPQQVNGERVEVGITTDFTQYLHSPSAGYGGTALGIFARFYPALGSPPAVTLVIFSATALLLFAFRSSKKVYAAVVILVIVSLLVSPLWESRKVYAFTHKQVSQREAYAQEQAEQEALDSAAQTVYGGAWDPHRASSAQQSGSQDAEAVPGMAQSASFPQQFSIRSPQAAVLDQLADDDGDGLTNGQEEQLGTDPEEKDTDGDQITDDVEIAGFTYQGQAWYTNPLDPDTNNDGRIDGLECPERARPDESSLSPGGICQDLDGDQTPDVFDRDDDGDGVPDRMDLSPASLADNNGQGYTVDAPLLLQVDDLQAGEPAFVDFQLRPVNPDHLWYALNVLDWPSGDEQGQVQRRQGNDSTFADVDGELASANASNGDLRLIPMLEIEIPYKDGHYGNLPVKDGAPLTRTAAMDLEAWLDTGKLEPYGISVHPMNDDGDLAAYVPLNLVADETGGDRVAFAARMLYWPTGESVSDWGNTQKVRLVWLLQALIDQCVTPEEGGDCVWTLDQRQMVHAYGDEWALTGLAVAEDHGVQVAVAYEDPAQEPSAEARQYDDWLWALAHGLDAAFITGRDCDTLDANDQCVGDGQRDITTDVIQLRWDNRANGGTSDEQRWGIPITATQVITFSYEHEGYLAQIAMTETHKILSDTFSAYLDLGAEAPLLLFAVENHQRTTNLDAEETVTRRGAQLTIGLDEEAAPLEVYASLRWAPFRYEQDAWKSYPVAEYWDRLEIHLKDALRSEHEGEADLDAILGGQILLAQGYFLSFYQGVSGLVQRGSAVLSLAAPEQSDSAQIEWLFGTDARKAGGIQSRVAYSIANLTAKALKAGGYEKNPQLFFKAIYQFFKEGKTTALGKLLLWKKSLGGRIKLFGTALAVLATIGVVIAAAVLAGTHQYQSLAKLILGVSAATAALDAVLTGIKVTKLLNKAGGSLRGAMKLAGGKYKLGAASVGLIIAVLVTWGVFAYVACSSGAKAGSMALNALAAQTIAATITAVIMLAIAAIPVVGQIVATLIFLIDSITALICELKDSEHPFCLGITGYVARGITWILYNGDIMLDLEKKDRLKIASFDQQVVDPARGITAGSGMVIRATVRNTVELIEWSDTDYNWMAGLYWWQYSSSTLASATFRYHLQSTPVDQHQGLSRGGIPGHEWEPDHCDPEDDGCTFEQSVSKNITLPQAGINRGLPLYLSEAMAIPAQECWLIPIFWPIPAIPVCYVRTERASAHINLGQDMRYDVFPPTLDEFYALSAKEGGYALAWSQDTHPSFPRLADADGDGLRNAQDDGADPDDADWDLDQDGLSDYFERQQNSLLNDPDSDNDGLSDHAEAILTTDPRRTDSDYDGLTDQEELAGWEFVYAFAADGSPLRTWVTSDPLQLDPDGDGLTDFQEKTYGFHPRVWTDPHILTFDSQVREEYAPRLLLRLDETGGATTLRDDSGYGNNASCSAENCPASGHEGRYLNALHFDGVDDFAAASRANTDELQYVTLAAWVKLEALTGHIMRFISLKDEKAVLRYDGANGPGQLHFYLRVGGSLWSLRANGVLQSGVWQHVAGTYDGATMRLYLDGVEIASQPVGGVLDGGEGVWLSHPTETLAGYLDEVVVCDQALPAQGIQKALAGRYNPADSLVAPGDSLYYQATVKNELTSRYAQGLLGTHFPAGFSDIPPEDFVLNPQEAVTLAGRVAVSPAAASGVYSLTQEADAFITDWREASSYAELLFHFDESAPPYEDSSGSQPPRNGDCAAPHCPAAVSGPHGNAVQFDGIDDYVTADAVSAYLDGEALSFGAWVYLEAGQSGYGALMAFNTAGGGNRNLVKYESSTGRLVYYDDHTHNVASASAFTPGQWHQVMVVIAADNAGRLYVNGVEEASFNTPVRPDGEGKFSLGQEWDGGNTSEHFLGRLDEAVVFNRALAAGDVQALYAQPVFDLPLDEPAGATTFSDESGFGNHAVCQGERCPAAGGAGAIGPAVQLDGNDYLTVAGDPALDLSSSSFSLSAWVYPTGGPKYSDCPFIAEYWNYMHPGYQMVLRRCEDLPIDYDWGAGSPDPVVNPDDFWVRWVGDYYFAEGDYTFTAEHDDRIYFKIDDNPIFSASNVGTDTKTVHLAAGYHRLYVSYEEYGGLARLRFSWSPNEAYHLQGILGGADYPALERTSNNEVRIRFPTADGPVEFTSAADALTTWQWNHLAAVYNGASYQLYVNGVELGEVAAAGEPVSGSDFYLGRANAQAALTLKSLRVVDMGDPQQGNYYNDGEYIIQYRENGGSWQTLWSGANLEADDQVNLNLTRTFAGEIEIRVYENDAGEYQPGQCGPFQSCQDDPADDPMGARSFTVFQPGETGVTTFQNTHTYFGYPIHDEVKLTWELANAGLPLRGGVDAVKIYKYALDPVQVNQLYTAGDQVVNYTLDDPPGSVEFADALGANPLSCSGDACPLAGIPGRQNYALRFDGQDDTAAAAGTGVADLQEFTLAGWVKPLSLPGGAIARFVTLGNEKAVLRYDGVDGTGQLHFYARINGSLQHIRVDNALQAEVWQHVAGTYDGEAMKLYLNGEPIGSSLAITGTVGGGDAVRLSSASEPLDGLLDEIVVYRRALSADQVQALYQSAPEMLLLLDETEGAAAFADETGNGHTGACSGNRCPHAGVKGQLGLAAGFDGVNDYIQVPDSPALDPEQALTLAVWVKMTAADVDQKIAGKATIGSGYVLGIEDGQLYPEVWDSSGQRFSALWGSITPGYWTHLAVTWETNGDLIGYINGEEAGRIAASDHPIGANTSPLRVGIAPWNTSSFPANGRIDHVTLYRRALGAEELRALFRLQAKWVEERQSTRVTVDGAAPASTLVSADPYHANQEVMLLVSAADNLSAVAMVELGVSTDGGASYTWEAAPRCQDSAGSTAGDKAAWCPTFRPALGEGRYLLRTRATDGVGNTETPAQTYTFLVDDTPPVASTAIADGQLIAARRQPADAWAVPLSGEVVDPLIGGEPGSGAAAVAVRIYGADRLTDTLPIAAELAGAAWQADYPLTVADPTGWYTLEVQATDNVGNASAFAALVQIGLDGKPPEASLDSPGEISATITTTLSLTGLVTETGAIHAGVAGVQLSLIPAAMATLSDTLALIHFEEADGSTRYASDTGGTAACAGSACPQTAAQGAWGQAASFDGAGDYLAADFASQNYRPGKGFSFGAWVYPEYNAPRRALLAFTDAGGGRRNQIVHQDYTLRYADGEVDVPIGYAWLGWAQVMVTIDENGYGVAYLNGEAQASFTTSVRPDPDGRFSLGQAWDGAAPADFYTGWLDEVAVYNRALAPEEVRALYGSAALADSGAGVIAATWAYTVPAGLEGLYEVNLLPEDVFANAAPQAQWPAWTGAIDTRPPQVEITAEETVSYLSMKTQYTCIGRDFNLVFHSSAHPANNFTCPCDTLAPLATTITQTFYHQVSPWYAATFTDTNRLYQVEATCTVPGPAIADSTTRACDVYGRCTTAVAEPSQVELFALLDSAVYTPTHSQVITQSAPLAVQGEAYARDHLQLIYVYVDAQLIDTHYWPAPGTQQASWTSTWPAPVEGPHTLWSVAVDHNNQTQTFVREVAIRVDTLPPAVTLDTTVITTTHRLSQGRVRLSGQAADMNGIKAVEVQVDGGEWQPAAIFGLSWQYDWYIGEEPAGATYTVAVRARDLAGRETQSAYSVYVDLEVPNPIELTLTHNSAVITPGLTLRAVPAVLDLAWITSTVRADLLPYEVRWLVNGGLAWGHLVPTSGPFVSQYVAGEGQEIVVQVISRLLDGNQQVDTYGPVYVDGPVTPDAIAFPAALTGGSPYRGWMESGCSLIGTDRRIAANAQGGAALDGEQRFYATWDTEALRLAWTGADWDYDGDLFIYLDTAAGGALQAYDPYTGTGGATVQLPGSMGFGADQLVWVENADTAHLLTWDGNGWVDTNLTSAEYRFAPGLNAGHTDLYLPFDLLGISDPLVTPLALVAFATEEGALNLWGTMPSANPVNAARVLETRLFAGETVHFGLTQVYFWPSLAPAVCPSRPAGLPLYTDTDLRFELSVDPAGAAYSFLGDNLFWLWEALITATHPADLSAAFAFMDVDHPQVGDGQVITYTLFYANQGTYTATNVSVGVLALFGLQLEGGSPQGITLTLGSLPPGALGSVTFRGQVDLAATYEVCLVENPGAPELCEPLRRWAGLQAVVYDAAHGVGGNPLDWLFADHRIDSEPPEFFDLLSPQVYVNPGENIFQGYAYDPSGVPWVTLDTLGAFPASCGDAAPQDGQWTCAWDATAANGGTPPSDGEQFDLRLQAHDAYGQSSAWTAWRAFVVDAVPPLAAYSVDTTQAYSNTVVNDSVASFSGTANDNHGLAGVEVCLNGVCGPANLQTAAAALYTFEDAQAAPIGASTTCGGGEIVRTFTVTESVSVGTVSLGFNADHARRNDLLVRLGSPAGTWVQVIGPQAGSPYTALNYDVLLADAAAAGLHDGRGDQDPAPPYYNHLSRPDDPLRLFRGEAAAGVWTLTLCDTQPAEFDGYYQRSQLRIEPGNTAAPSGQWFYTAAGLEDLDYAPQLLAAYATDLAGNRTTTPITLAFTIDNVAPVLTATQLVERAALPLERTGIRVLAGTAADGGRIVQMYALVKTPQGSLRSMQVGRAGEQNWWFDLFPDQAGSYLIWVNAVDEGQNTATLGFFQVNVVSLGVENDSPTRLGASTILTATVRGDEGYLLAWDFGEGAAVSRERFSTAGDQSAVISHTYAAVGVYTATVTAIRGDFSLTAASPVVVDQAIAGLTAAGDSPTPIGDPTVLEAAISAGSNVSYTWDLGDGVSLDGAQVAHTYPYTGVFTATVSAWNSVSHASAAASVVVIVSISQTVDLQLDKTASSSLLAAGDLLTYTLAVVNAGPLTATQVILTDTLPAGVTVTRITASQGACSGESIVVCQLGELAAGGSAQVTIVVRVGAETPGMLTNTAAITAAEQDRLPANNTAERTVEVRPPGYPIYLPIIRK